jgi:hypothetical protein
MSFSSIAAVTGASGLYSQRAPQSSDAVGSSTMSRAALFLIVGMSLLAVSGYLLVAKFLWRGDAPFRGPCRAWLSQPSPRWVELEGCVLDTPQTLVEADTGELEALASRAEGLSTHLFAKPPKWVAAWIPIRDDAGRANVVRAVYRTESADLIRWINMMDSAPDARRQEMWADQGVLRRIARPGVLMGTAAKPQTEMLRKTWGSMASAAMLVVTPGEPPPFEFPTLAFAIGVAGLLLAVAGLRSGTGSKSQQSAEQMLTVLNTNDVKVELGALESVREEERRRRR